MLDHKVTGFTASTFDLLHAGHILMLREAKKYCTHLTVALQTDPSIDRPEKNKPVQSMLERWTQVEAVKYVDAIIPYDTEHDLQVLLQTLKPDVRILGDDYVGRDFTGKQWCIENDVILVYANRDHEYSTAKLRKKIYETEQAKQATYPINIQ